MHTYQDEREANKLTNYRSRRRIERSGEPYGKIHKKKNSKKQIFVVHKHESRHLHYDVRLEIDGVLVSWAVPKGPSLDPQKKRLALRTDDHPIAYASFEGVIPKNEYGAGTVMVWDTGTFKNIKKKGAHTIPLKKCLKEGLLEVMLNGKKLYGGFVFIRTDQNKWLMIKMNDEFADKKGNILKKTESVKTDRSMKEIKKDG